MSARDAVLDTPPTGGVYSNHDAHAPFFRHTIDLRPPRCQSTSNGAGRHAVGGRSIGGRPMKLCPSCKRHLDRACFHRHRSKRDGLRCYCRECENTAQRERHRRRYAVNREALAERAKRWQVEHPNPARRAATNARYRAAHPDAGAAGHAVNHAIARGDLAREPCERCGTTPSEGHHDDYTKPLEVRWLCDKCHKRLHRERRAAAWANAEERR